MKKRMIMIVLLTLCLSPASFAEVTATNPTDPDEATSKQCEKIADACRNAGFARRDQGKYFWRDCMKPILYGQSVAGVTVDKNDVKACRQFKIQNMQQQLDEMKKHVND